MKLLLAPLFSLLLLFASAIAPAKYQQALGVGIDVNWAMFKKEIQYFDQEQVKDFKQIGFRHIRLRFKDPQRLGMDKEKYLRHLENVVQACLREGLFVVLAYDAYEFKAHPNQESLQKVLAYWRQIANRFQRYPKSISYNLIIEPSQGLNKRIDLLNAFYKKTFDAIRAIDKKRIIILAPPKISNPFYLGTIDFPKDPFIMAEWHFYASGPSKTNPKKLWTTGTEYEKELIRQKIAAAKAWEKKSGIKTWVGAWMPGNYNKGNDYTIQEQVDFATFMSCELRKNGIPFAINADHKFYDYIHNRFYEERLPVLKAILKPNCR